MHSELNLFLILSFSLITLISPGPATLAITATSMGQSRKHGLVLASGISTGSIIWNVSAALGLGAIMAANPVFVDFFRYFGSAYLLYLAYKSLRSALNPSKAKTQDVKPASFKTTYLKGLALHLTNPKAILFFTALYAIGVPADATFTDLAIVVFCVAAQAALVMHIYAYIFSIPKVVNVYIKLKRWFETVFAVAFGFAGVKILLSDMV
ncbi:MAG: LysE family translocator [Alphaproteobacteria bacterium]|nr:LysE family translocator [Alphaproteobacteria bacterium]